MNDLSVSDHNESFFDLLFRDESPDEGYSLLGIALLASLAFHLFFITFIKIKTYPIDENPQTHLPTLVTFDTSYGSIVVSNERDESENNYLNPKQFGYVKEILDEQVPLPLMDPSLFQEMQSIMTQKDFSGTYSLHLLGLHLLEKQLPDQIEFAPPNTFPLQIKLQGEIQPLALIYDGSDLFSHSCFEGLFVSPKINPIKNSCSFDVEVQGFDGAVLYAQTVATCKDNRLQLFANRLVKKLRFSPELTHDVLHGTVVMEFACSGEFMNLLTKDGLP